MARLFERVLNSYFKKRVVVEDDHEFVTIRIETCVNKSVNNGRVSIRAVEHYFLEFISNNEFFLFTVLNNCFNEYPSHRSY